MMGNKNTVKLIPRGTVTHDRLESRLEGDLTGVFWNQRIIGYCFIQFLH